MRVVICPDKFAGTLSAPAAAAALASGWHSIAPTDQLLQRPIADGGPGFLEVLGQALAAHGARAVPAETVDPLGRPVPGSLLVAGGRCYVESAQACGLHLLGDDERDPMVTSSYGLGMLLAAAAAQPGVTEVVVGLGGSAVNDAGAGMLDALGAPALAASGDRLRPGGAALAAAAALGGQPRWPGIDLLAATDVDNPLLGPEGASAVFGPQKGATAVEVELLDVALGRFAEVLARELPGSRGELADQPDAPAGLADRPGAGAAGGLGAALLALGARRVSGARLVRELTGLDQAIATADLVITGEGSFDSQSLRGKVVTGVADEARRRGVPCLVVAGRVDVEPALAAAAGITATRSLVEHFEGDVAAAMAHPAVGLIAIGAALATAAGAGPASADPPR